MTRPWWAGAMRRSLASLVGRARADDQLGDPLLADASSRALLGRVGLDPSLFADSETRSAALVSLTVDMLLEHRLSTRLSATVVHLGGGLSSRALRFARWPVRWIEVDDPAIHAIKAATMGASSGDSIACELGDTRWVDEVLERAHGDVLVVSDVGLLEAPEGEVLSVLDAIAFRMARGVELIFAHDVRHRLCAGRGGAPLVFERTGEHGERLLVRYPSLRRAERGEHHPDVARALDGVAALHALQPSITPQLCHARRVDAG